MSDHGYHESRAARYVTSARQYVITDVALAI